MMISAAQRTTSINPTIKRTDPENEVVWTETEGSDDLPRWKHKVNTTREVIRKLKVMFSPVETLRLCKKCQILQSRKMTISTERTLRWVYEMSTLQLCIDRAEFHTPHDGGTHLSLEIYLFSMSEEIRKECCS
jgi:hypothetical protein